MTKRYRIKERNDGQCEVQAYAWHIWWTVRFHSMYGSWDRIFDNKQYAKDYIDGRIKAGTDVQIKNLEEYP